MREKEYIIVEDNGDVTLPYSLEDDSLNIPTKIKEVVASSIDALDPRLALVAKVISVAEEVCDLQMLDAIFPVEQQRQYLPQLLTQLVSLGHIGRTTSLIIPGVVFAFRNRAVRDAVYATLLHQQAVKLHCHTLYQIYTRVPQDHPDKQALTAYHWRQVIAMSSFVELNAHQTTQAYETLLATGRQDVADGQFFAAAKNLRGAAFCARNAAPLTFGPGEGEKNEVKALAELYEVLRWTTSTQSDQRTEVRERMFHIWEQSTTKPEWLRTEVVFMKLYQVHVLVDGGKFEAVPDLHAEIIAIAKGYPALEVSTHASLVNHNLALGEGNRGAEAAFELLNRWEAMGSPPFLTSNISTTLFTDAAVASLHMADEAGFMKWTKLIESVADGKTPAVMKRRSDPKGDATISFLRLALSCLQVGMYGEFGRCLKIAWDICGMLDMSTQTLQGRWSLFCRLAITFLGPATATSLYFMNIPEFGSGLMMGTGSSSEDSFSTSSTTLAGNVGTLDAGTAISRALRLPRGVFYLGPLTLGCILNNQLDKAEELLQLLEQRQSAPLCSH